MSLTQFNGRGPLVPGFCLNAANSLGVAAFGPIDATGEKLGITGRYWNPTGATKNIERIGFRFGSVTKAGGSALTLSLQDAATAAAPGQPDETQDQTVAIANADSTFATSAWHRTGTLSATRSLAPGSIVSVVLEFDGGGRLGADAANMSFLLPVGSVLQQNYHSLVSAVKAGSWAIQNNCHYPNIVFEATDGTFGSFEGGIIFSATGTYVLQTGTTPDEVAIKIVLTREILIDGIYATALASATNATFDVVLYDSGGTALETGSFNPFQSWNVTQYLTAVHNFVPRTLAAGTYYVALKPTAAVNVTGVYIDVDNAAHLLLNPFPNGTYVTRTDAGAWSETTTRMPFHGFRLAGVHQSGGGVGPLIDGRLIRA